MTGGEVAPLAMECVAAVLQRHELSRAALSSRLLQSKSALNAVLSAAMSSQLSLHTEIPPTDLKLQKKLGDGTEASVWLAEWKSQSVAVKKFRQPIISSISLSTFFFISLWNLVGAFRIERSLCGS